MITPESILEKCEFDDECDFCTNPKGGTFVRSHGGYEYYDDYYWICGKCFTETATKFPTLNEIGLMEKIDKKQGDLPVNLPF